MLDNTSINIVFGMSFLTFSIADIQFNNESFTWRTYCSAEALAPARRGEFINKYKFSESALNDNYQTFVMHVAALKTWEPTIDPIWASVLAPLQQTQTTTSILYDNNNHIDVFSLNLTIKLLENTYINEYAIELIEDKQSLYSSIYCLSQVKLEIVKTYIKTYLKTEFTRSAEFFAGASIFSYKTSVRSLQLCVDYRCQNNLIIKNRNFFTLIGESLDCWG